jgi:hypothetical protein
MGCLNTFIGQAEMDSMDGAHFGTDTALLAKVYKDCSFIFDQSHDLSRTALDTNAAAIAFKNIYFWDHFVNLL